jgi:transcriptional regulator with XRE-family HTH domain
MDLDSFLDLVGAKNQELAEALGMNRSTIWRIRHREVIPKAATALAILRWAEVKAREKRLPVRDRLTFEALVEERAA